MLGEPSPSGAVHLVNDLGKGCRFDKCSWAYIPAFKVFAAIGGIAVGRMPSFPTGIGTFDVLVNIKAALSQNVRGREAWSVIILLSSVPPFRSSARLPVVSFRRESFDEIAEKGLTGEDQYCAFCCVTLRLCVVTSVHRLFSNVHHPFTCSFPCSTSVWDLIDAWNLFPTGVSWIQLIGSSKVNPGKGAFRSKVC